jgi:hypothetical protein
MAIRDQLYAPVTLPQHPLGMRLKVDTRPGLESLKKKNMFIACNSSGFL